MRRRQWQPTPVLLPGKSHGWRSLVGCSPWRREESDMTERLHFDFSLSCIGEGNGNPLQCSCLENPRDGGAWWAAVYGVAQGQTQLKRLSSSSSSTLLNRCFVPYWTSTYLWMFSLFSLYITNNVPMNSILHPCLCHCIFGPTRSGIVRLKGNGICSFVRCYKIFLHSKFSIYYNQRHLVYFPIVLCLSEK